MRREIELRVHGFGRALRSRLGGSSRTRGPAAGRGLRRGLRRQAVVVNLRLDSEQTRALGLENHVCELQLVLRGFAPAQAIRRARSPPAGGGRRLDVVAPRLKPVSVHPMLF